MSKTKADRFELLALAEQIAQKMAQALLLLSTSLIGKS